MSLRRLKWTRWRGKSSRQSCTRPLLSDASGSNLSDSKATLYSSKKSSQRLSTSIWNASVLLTSSHAEAMLTRLQRSLSNEIRIWTSQSGSLQRGRRWPNYSWKCQYWITCLSASYGWTSTREPSRSSTKFSLSIRRTQRQQQERLRAWCISDTLLRPRNWSRTSPTLLILSTRDHLRTSNFWGRQ